MKDVKLLRFRELPNEAIFNTALDLMGKNALDYGVYEYEVGFYTDGEYALDKDSPEYTDFKELDDFLLEKGIALHEEIYLKW